jgi:uncharacterized protein YdeI (YjbR/CyaY-like superfamily)
MPTDPRVDHCIASSPAFAQPILEHLRAKRAGSSIKTWQAPPPRKPAPPRKPEAEVPEDFAAALAKNKAASQAFHRFSPSHRHEYIEWITEAKRDETRQKRIATTLEWLTEGKPRNWKYMNC